MLVTAPYFPSLVFNVQAIDRARLVATQIPTVDAYDWQATCSR
jgi:hypothetical protein